MSDKEFRRARELAMVKISKAPKPTAEDRKTANQRIDEAGADKYESNIRGNANDRAASRQRLLHEFGDGHTCSCVYCGLKLDSSTVTRDKIWTAREGGKYRHDNLLPSCLACNQSRGDVSHEEIKWSKH